MTSNAILSGPIFKAISDKKVLWNGNAFRTLRIYIIGAKAFSALSQIVYLMAKVDGNLLALVVLFDVEFQDITNLTEVIWVASKTSGATLLAG